MVTFAKNTPLAIFRRQFGFSQSEAAKYAHVSQTDWSQLEALTFEGHPPRVLQTIRKVAMLLGVEEDVVTPSDFPREVPFTTLPEKELAQVDLATATVDQPAAERRELEDAIWAVLLTLTYREREVIKLRFGFDGDSYTLEQVGKIFKVNRERIRQIQAKAMRKLQHPVRVAKLRGFL